MSTINARFEFTKCVCCGTKKSKVSAQSFFFLALHFFSLVTCHEETEKEMGTLESAQNGH